jgi:methylmalonyl-CoA/ethylmalonyl-CoA epimerase
VSQKPAANPGLGTPTRARPAGLHHVGYVVASIAELGKDFARSIGAHWDGEVIHDPLQEAAVTFMRCGGPDTPAIELVEPAGENSPLRKFVTKGGGLHHVCYEVDSLDAQLEQSRAAGCLVVKNPLPAVAFGGRRIAWVYTRQKLLVEYLERPGLDSAGTNLEKP